MIADSFTLQDAEENMQYMEQYGKCKVLSSVLSEEHSRHESEAEETAPMITGGNSVDVGVVKHAKHTI